MRRVDLPDAAIPITRQQMGEEEGEEGRVGAGEGEVGDEEGKVVEDRLESEATESEEAEDDMGETKWDQFRTVEKQNEKNARKRK